MATIAYARVSTDDQDTRLQRTALREAGPVKLFEDKISSRKTERPGLTAALDYLREGDKLLVWKIDRLGRSVKEVLILADELHERGIGPWILTGTLAGTYTPTGEGKFFFTIMAAFAELERDMIHQRAMAGLAAARAQGRIGGRPTVLDPDKLAAARARTRRTHQPRRQSAEDLSRHALPTPRHHRRPRRPLTTRTLTQSSRQHRAPGRHVAQDPVPILVRPLQVRGVPTTAQVARWLDVPAGTMLIRRRRIRVADDTPVSIADSWFPTDIADRECEVNGKRVKPIMVEQDIAVAGGFVRAIGINQVEFRDEIRVRMPSPEESRLLDLGTGTPVGEHARVGIDDTGRRIRVIISVFPGNRMFLAYTLEA